VHAQQNLRDREREQFGIGEPGWPSVSSGPTQMIVDLDVECGQKGVQVCRHKRILNTLLPSPDTAPT
jgi:hypothetical protein